MDLGTTSGPDSFLSTKLDQSPATTELARTTKLVQDGTGSSLMLHTANEFVAMLGDVAPGETEERVQVSCPVPVWPGSSPFSVSEESGMLLAGEEKLFVWKFEPDKVRFVIWKGE